MTPVYNAGMDALIQKIKNHRISLSAGLLVLTVAGGALYGYRQYKENNTLTSRISGLESQIQDLATSVQKSSEASKNSAVSLKEETTVKKNVVVESQNTQLTTAVAKVAPSVVSVVVSKDVPQVEVSYENPFGDDPFFKGFNFQIPVYKQIGTTTQEIGAATGFFVSPKGYIITNKHVVSDKDATYTVLLSTGSQKNAYVVYQDPSNDIAILKIDGSGYQTAQLGDSSSLKLGETVAAIGNALGKYSNSVSVGVISGINRSIQATDQNGNVVQLRGVLQTDTAINSGNSGGPLFNLEGNVIGVNVATVTGSNSISFSIPINEVKKIISREVL